MTRISLSVGSQIKYNPKSLGISSAVAVAIVVIIIAAAGVGAYATYGLNHGGGTGTSSNISSSTGTGTASGTRTTTSSCTNDCTSIGTGPTNTTQTGSQYGLLSVLISDPPHIPDNVSAVLITYPSMFVHTANLPGGEGWIQIPSSGSIQLLGAVNVGQTVASASVPAGVYNMIRFNVSSAVVTYNGQNYTASIQNGNLTIHFISSLMVDPLQSSALVIDIQPFVYNFGTLTSPSFVLKPTALSFVVPQGSVTSQMHQIGNKYQFYANNTWFWRYRNAYYPNINITSGTVSGSSLTTTIANPSNQTVVINAITVTALQSTAGGYGKGSGNGSRYGPGYEYGVNASTPTSLSGSAVFLILPNGTLTQLSRTQYSGTPLNLSSLIWGGAGYPIATGGSVSLSYSGFVELSLRMPANGQPGVIVSGQQYLISVVGDGVCANLVVAAT